MFKKGFSKVLTIVIVLVVIGGGVLIWQWPSGEIGESVVNRLSLDVLRNIEYYSSGFPKPIKLTDGSYTYTSPAEGVTEIEEQWVTYGDLNGDGEEDVIVALKTSGGGTGVFRELGIVLNKEGEPFNINPSIWLGDRPQIHSIAIQSGVIVIDVTPKAESRKTIQYKLLNEELQKVPVEDGTSDWQTYRNEKYGFEMRHPENWKLLQEADGISFQPPFSDLYFNIDKMSSQFTVKEILAGIDIDPISVIEQKNIQVDAHIAIQRNTSYSRAPEGEHSWITYIEDRIEQGYSITIIRLIGKPEVINEAVVSLYNQILSTFKFID